MEAPPGRARLDHEPARARFLHRSRAALKCSSTRDRSGRARSATAIGCASNARSVVAIEELGGDMRVPRLRIERQEQPVEHPVEVRSEQQSPVASMFRAIREAVEVRGIEHLFGLTPGHRARRPKPLKEPFAEDPLSHADAHERLNVTATDLVCVSKQLEVEGALHACMAVSYTHLTLPT